MAPTATAVTLPCVPTRRSRNDSEFVLGARCREFAWASKAREGSSSTCRLLAVLTSRSPLATESGFDMTKAWVFVLGAAVEPEDSASSRRAH
jgi:hypothetical protein